MESKKINFILMVEGKALFIKTKTAVARRSGGRQ
jgi:hypothetical protein